MGGFDFIGGFVLGRGQRGWVFDSPVGGHVVSHNRKAQFQSTQLGFWPCLDRAVYYDGSGCVVGVVAQRVAGVVLCAVGSELFVDLHFFQPAIAGPCVD